MGKHELARDFARGAIQNLLEDPNQVPDDEVMATAYYNLGVENEHLRDYEAAKDCFAKSKLAKDILPEI